MLIRITGTRAETTSTAALLAELLPVLKTSRFYPNRESSSLGQVYLETASPLGFRTQADSPPTGQ